MTNRLNTTNQMTSTWALAAGAVLLACIGCSDLGAGGAGGNGAAAGGPGDGGIGA